VKAEPGLITREHAFRRIRTQNVGYVSGGVLGLFWAWYCKKAGWFLHRVLLDEPAGNTPLSVVASMSLYVGVLLSSTLLQYALYRCLRFNDLRRVRCSVMRVGCGNQKWAAASRRPSRNSPRSCRQVCVGATGAAHQYSATIPRRKPAQRTFLRQRWSNASRYGRR
jgi:hypothetical protein